MRRGKGKGLEEEEEKCHYEPPSCFCLFAATILRTQVYSATSHLPSLLYALLLPFLSFFIIFSVLLYNEEVVPEVLEWVFSFPRRRLCRYVLGMMWRGHQMHSVLCSCVLPCSTVQEWAFLAFTSPYTIAFYPWGTQ